jgi:hypothetical protein
MTRRRFEVPSGLARAAKVVLAGVAVRAGIRRLAVVTAVAIGSVVPPAVAQDRAHAMPGAAVAPADARQLVEFPVPMRMHTLRSMRDHLSALQEIDVALAEDAYGRAASIAEQRLGMSSLELHGSAHLAPFMPQGMQDIGTQMHRAASRFAIAAQTASASGDVRPALAALGAVMQQCVACHGAYRLH